MKKLIFFFSILLVLGVYAPIFAGIKVARISGAKMYWEKCTAQVVVNSQNHPYKAQLEITIYYTSKRGFAKLQVAQDENSKFYIPVDLYYNSKIKLNTYYRFYFKVSSDGTKIDNIDAYEIGCSSGTTGGTTGGTTSGTIISKIDVPLVNCAPNCLAIFGGPKIPTNMNTFFTDRPIEVLAVDELGTARVLDSKRPAYVIPTKLISPYIEQKNWQEGLGVLKNYHQDLINQKQITPNMPEMDFKIFLKSNQQYLQKELNTGMLFSESEIKKRFPAMYKN